MLQDCLEIGDHVLAAIDTVVSLSNAARGASRRFRVLMCSLAVKTLRSAANLASIIAKEGPHGEPQRHK
jgi:hypothetical protein